MFSKTGIETKVPTEDSSKLLKCQQHVRNQNMAVPHSLLQGVHYEFEEIRDGHLRRVPSNHIPTACPHSVIHRLEL